MTFKGYLINKKYKIQNEYNCKTDMKMTLIKTFGIIAVVAGHTGGGGIVFPMANWVMPLFVFVSGYLYKLEYGESSSVAF